MTAPDDVRARLLPCPFCGPGESVVDALFDDVAQRWRVYCGRCGCSTGIHPRDRTQEPAIAAWNRRAAHADLAGEVRGLVEALKLARDYAAYVQGEPADLAVMDAALAKFTHQEKP